MIDKTDLKDLIKTIISLKPDGNHWDLTDEYQNGYIERQAEDILSVFVEQSCEAIDEKLRELASDQCIVDDMHAINASLDVAQQAIRDKFK